MEQYGITYTNEDCMKGMARYPDKYFDLAIVDPPYFKGVANRSFYGSEISVQEVNGCALKVVIGIAAFHPPNITRN